MAIMSGLSFFLLSQTFFRSFAVRLNLCVPGPFWFHGSSGSIDKKVDANSNTNSISASFLDDMRYSKASGLLNLRRIMSSIFLTKHFWNAFALRKEQNDHSFGLWLVARFFVGCKFIFRDILNLNFSDSPQSLPWCVQVWRSPSYYVPSS